MATDADEFTRNKVCCQPQSIYGPQLSDRKVFVVHHEGEWLTGYTAVVAHTQEEAIKILLEAWRKSGRTLSMDAGEVVVIDPQKAQVVEIWNGDY